MKRRWIGALSFAVLVFVTLLVAARVGSADAEQEQNEVRIGLKIAPVPLNLENKDVHLVGLGSYIVNAQSACADCHSCPTYVVGGNPYFGQRKQLNPNSYLAGGVLFGPFVSWNITPDENGKPAGLNRDQFKHVIHTGNDPDNPSQLLQVMPWPFFQDMTDHDLNAIYEYLRSIPAAPTPPAGSCSGAGQ